MRFAVEKNLPKGYIPLQYLQSTGTQYINTGISGNNPNLKIEVDATTYEFGWCHQTVVSGVWVDAFSFPTDNKERVNYGSYSLAKDFTYDKTTRKVRTFDFQTGFYIDGVLGQSFTISNYSSLTPSLPLFARYDFNSSSYSILEDSSYKIYGCKIYDNGTLVRDFIPALRKSDNVAGMYDKVTNTFFTNAGTGSFLYTKEEENVELLNNPNYKQVEYLESTGTQYINADFKPNTNTRTVGRVRFNSFVGSSADYIFGVFSSPNNYGLNIGYARQYFNVPWGSNSGISLDGLIPQLNTDYEFDISKTGYLIDGQSYGTTGAESINSTRNMYLFWANGTSASGMNGRIYYLKIYDDGVLVRNFIPVIRKEDNKPGMYDTVSGTFFENKGTGEFLTGRILDPLPAKYEELAYVESTGTQYIDTGVNFDCAKTAIEVKTYETSLTQIHSILGDNENNVYFFKGTNNWAAGYNKTVFHLDSYVTLGDNLFKLDKNNLYFNGNLVKTYVASTTVSSSNILLFNRKKSALDAGPANIYYCRIWNDDILVRDFVPCVRKSDNKVGMYDRVNGGFYTNLGTGNFTGVEKTRQKEKTVRLVKTVSNGDLPYGLTEVEYLESTGTQWIDTEYTPTSDNFKYEGNIQASVGWFFGYRSVSTGTTTGDMRAMFVYPDGRMAIRYGAASDNSTLKLDSNKVCKVFFDGTSVYVDDVNFVSVTERYNNPVYKSMYLFAANATGYYSSDMTMFNGKIYNWKIWDDDTLVRDFVPVLDKSNVPCMYDKVSKKCFYNKGTGSFTAGRKINYVDYLGSDSTAYVDTAVSGANDNLKIEMGFSYSKFTAYGYLFSNYESETANVIRFCLNGTDTDWGLAYINTRSQNGAIYTSKFTKNDFHTLVLTKTSASIDGDIKTNSNPPVGTENTKNIILFNRGADSYYEKRDIGMRCYYFRIYDNDVLIRDFIPAMDENQVGFMFDKVTHTIYDNKGTGTFSYGSKLNPFTLRLIEDVS